MTVITRFAPSPTGNLHIGGARTALFNYLFAKNNNGIFKLRIEDTDKERSKRIFTEDIFNSMKWLGLEWDKDVVYQSDNISDHVALAEKLLSENKAYKCYCSKEEIEEARIKAKNEKKAYRYDRKWRNFVGKLDKPYVVRIKIPLNNSTVLNDRILGKITLNNNELDDFIILRSDKTPTYMLSVVADDKSMGVTDVIRGDDHLTNTFKQLILFDLFKWNKPCYSHIPLIHSKDGNKLSKRQGDLSVKQYKENMFLPEALLNYLLRLGWGYGDKEFFTKDEAIKLFSLKGIGKSAARFDEKKLNYINTKYFKKLTINQLKLIVSNSYPIKNVNQNYLSDLLNTFQERSEDINSFLYGLEYMLNDADIVMTEKAKGIIDSSNKLTLDKIIKSLVEIESWNAPTIEEELKKLSKNFNLNLFKIASPIRAAVTGKSHSPSIFKILELLGKEPSIKRLKKSF